MIRSAVLLFKAVLHETSSEPCRRGAHILEAGHPEHHLQRARQEPDRNLFIAYLEIGVTLQEVPPDVRGAAPLERSELRGEPAEHRMRESRHERVEIPIG